MDPVHSMPEPPPVAPPAPVTSLAGRLLNVIAAPGEVFEEIKAAPPRVANWLVPVLLFAVVGVISMCVMFAQPAILQTVRDQQAKAYDKMVQQGKMTQAQEDQILQFMGPTVLAVGGSIGIIFYSFVSIFGWALVLWLLGRWLLKTRLGYMKMVEVAGLSSLIIALSMVVGTLLCVIFGRLNAGLSLAMLVNDFDISNRVHLLLGAANVFNFWHVAVLAIGLAKLSGASMARTAIVIFAYWVLAELLLIAAGLGQWAL